MVDSGFSALVRAAGLDVSENCISALVEAMYERCLGVGEYLCHKGDVGDSLYIVDRGLLEVVTTSDDGQELILNSIRRAGLIGELTIIDASPRSASVRASEPSNLLGVGRGAFLDLARNEPELGLWLALVCARRLRRLTSWAEHRSFSSFDGRLAAALVELAGPYAGEPGRTSPIVRTTQQVLADQLGASRESVNKALQQWQSDGVVKTGRGTVELVEFTVLEDLAQA